MTHRHRVDEGEVERIMRSFLAWVDPERVEFERTIARIETFPDQDD